MKKLVVLAICACLSVASFGCGATQQEEQFGMLSKDDPITVTLWHYYAGAALETLTKNTDEFNKTIGAEHGVKVQIVSKPSIGDLEIELSESAQGVVYADEMPSMFLAYADKILELQELGVISDMNLFFSEEDKGLLIDDFMTSGVINDAQVMLPVVKSTEVLYLNETYFDEFAKVSGYTYDDMLTWNGLFDVAKSYHEYTDAMTPDIANDGKAFFGMDSINNFITVSSMQMGEDIFDAEGGKANLNEEVLREIFNYYMEAWAFGYVDAVAKYRTDDVRSGDLLGFIGSSAGFVYMPDWIEIDGDKEEITWRASQYPYFEGATPKVVSQGAGIAVSEISEQQQQACALFLNYFWEDNIAFALESAYVPVTNEFLEMDDAGKQDVFDTYQFQENEVHIYELVEEQIQEGRLYQSMPFDGSYIVRTELGYVFDEVADTLRTKAQSMLSEGKDKESVLEALEFDGVFKEMMEKLNTTLESKGVEK